MLLEISRQFAAFTSCNIHGIAGLTAILWSGFKSVYLSGPGSVVRLPWVTEPFSPFTFYLRPPNLSLSIVMVKFELTVIDLPITLVAKRESLRNFLFDESSCTYLLQGYSVKFTWLQVNVSAQNESERNVIVIWRHRHLFFLVIISLVAWNVISKV